MKRTIPWRGLACGAALLLAATARSQETAPALAPVDRAPRAFGDRTVTRALRVAGNGPYTLDWRTCVLRGVIEKGSVELAAPADVPLALHLPAVRTRTTLVLEAVLRRADRALFSAEFPIELFPTDLLAVAPQAPAPSPVGVIDGHGEFLAALQRTGAPITPITANLQFRDLASRVALVAPDQPETIAEPMSGLRPFLDAGGTVIFLEQAGSRRNLFDADESWRVEAALAGAADPLVARSHPLLLDLQPEDLTNWAGTGAVAAQALSWTEWPHQWTWLVARGPDPRPLLTEFRAAKGRVILCQMEIGARLESDPAAQLLLRNLVQYARLAPAPLPRFLRLAAPADGIAKGRFVRFQLNPNAQALREARALFHIPASAGPDGGEPDLVRLLREGHTALVQSAFDEATVSALNDLMRSIQPSKGRDAPAMRFGPAVEGVPESLDYDQPLLWGIPASKLARALDGADDAHFLLPERPYPGFRALTTPGVLAKLERGDVRLLFCALPPGDPENPDRAWVVERIRDNILFLPTVDQREETIR